MKKKKVFTDSQIIELLGGPTKIAKICKISVPAVSMWKNTGIPADKLVYLGAMLEQESKGLVTRKDLFPDSYQLIWPELRWAKFFCYTNYAGSSPVVNYGRKDPLWVFCGFRKGTTELFLKGWTQNTFKGFFVFCYEERENTSFLD